MKTPVRIAVTGAAGQIGYSLLFRSASGAVFGPDTPVILQLLEITPALGALEGVRMELDDCAFPLLAGIECTDNAEVAFGDADAAFLVGAMPRKDGMERGDLLSANGGIFKPQGQAIAAAAKKDIKVLVVGNPANTNALIAMNNAKGIDPGRFTAMTRLDHNRAVSQLAAKVGEPVTAIKKMTIWGNHSSTQYPDLFHCEVNGKSAAALINDQAWLENDFIPTVAKRGAAINGDFRTRHITAVISKQEQNQPRHFLGSALPSHGHRFQPRGIFFWRADIQHRRRNRPGMDGIHANATRRQFHRGGFRHAAQRPFRGTISECAR